MLPLALLLRRPPPLETLAHPEAVARQTHALGFSPSTLQVLLVIAAGAVAVILTTGFIRFSFDGLREAIIHGGLGHLELMPAGTAGPAGPDRSAPPALADEACRLLPQAVQWLQPGLGHLAHEEDPVGTAQQILRWCGAGEL